MNKYLAYIIILMLLIPISCFGWGAGDGRGFVGVAVAGGSPCDSCTPGTIVTDTTTATASYAIANFKAVQFTISSAICVSGYTIVAEDQTVNTCELKLSIFSDSSNEPGAVYSTDFDASITNLTDTLLSNALTVATPTELPAGTYWLHTEELVDGCRMGYDDSGGTFPTMISTGGAWSSNGFRMEFSIQGCE